MDILRQIAAHGIQGKCSAEAMRCISKAVVIRLPVDDSMDRMLSAGFGLVKKAVDTNNIEDFHRLTQPPFPTVFIVYGCGGTLLLDGGAVFGAVSLTPEGIPFLPGGAVPSAGATPGMCDVRILHRPVGMEDADAAGFVFGFVSMAQSLFACMNSPGVKTVSVDSGLKQREQRRIKPNGSPLKVYELAIRLPKKAGQPEEYKRITSIRELAEHVVRGHVRHYSKDRPMFGLEGMHGMFYIPPHLAGSPSNGRVKHNSYRVQVSA